MSWVPVRDLDGRPLCDASAVRTVTVQPAHNPHEIVRTTDGGLVVMVLCKICNTKILAEPATAHSHLEGVHMVKASLLKSQLDINNWYHCPWPQCTKPLPGDLHTVRKHIMRAHYGIVG